MYYKDDTNKLYFKPSPEIIKNENLTEITENEFNEILADTNKPTNEQVEKMQREKSMMEGFAYTLNGKEYTISVTKNDGDGLVQVKSAFDLGMTNTVIFFDNGTKLPINNEEFFVFAKWFVTKRNEFFK